MKTRKTWLRLAAWLAACAWMLSCAGALRAQTTYYIDPAAGSNANNGTSTSAPWKSHPYESAAAACTGSGSRPAYTHHAGDKFVWKGGTTSPAACFPLSISTGGASGAVDYYGVCLSTDTNSPCSGGTSWPSSGWTRPAFDAANTTISAFINASGKTYVTIDNLEMKNQNVAWSSSSTVAGCGIFFGNTRTWDSYGAGTTVENTYIHDWSLGSSGTNWQANSAVNGLCIGGIEGAQTVKNNTLSDLNGYAWIGGHQNVATCTGSNSDSCGGNGVAFAQTATGNTFNGGWLGVTDADVVDSNEFEHLYQNVTANVACGSGVCYHTQMVEDNEQCTALTGHHMTVSNNLFHDSAPGVVIFVRYFSDVFNNVGWLTAQITAGSGGGQSPLDICIPPGDSSSNVGHVFNNTWDTTESGTAAKNLIVGSGSALGTMYVQNNLIISPTGSANAGGITAATTHSSNNYAMAASEAGTYGFTSGNKYAPTSSDTANVTGKGLNLTSLCSGSMTALCSDGEGTAWFGGTAQPRPTGTTPWTLGGYAWPLGGGGGTPPAVTITAPSAGTVSGASMSFTSTCIPTSATVGSINESVDGTTFGGAGSSSPYTQTWDTTKMSNQAHTLGAGCTDSNNLTGTATPVAVTVGNSIPGCFISDFNWDNSQSIATQTGVFTLTFTATPFASANDLVVGISANPATAYGDMAAIVRFNPSGQIDVFNGSLGMYSALTSVSYTAGTAYAFTVTINISSHTYSVQLTSPANTTLATNYAFRGAQSGVTSLSYINAHSDLDSLHNVEVCNASLGSGTLQFTPGALSFGNVADGMTATNGVVVATANGGSATFTSVGISGDSAFTITGNTCTGTVSNCTVTVQFLGYGVGLKTATLIFTDSAGGSPQSIAVSAVSVPLPGVVVPIPTMVF